MPAGDAQRVWFPEMLSELRRVWSTNMSWEDLAALCARVTAMRREIRRSRGILPPLTRCRACGRVSRADIAGVSVRSALFALASEGLVTDAELRRLDRDWRKQRAAHRLDCYGQIAPPSEPAEPEQPPSPVSVFAGPLRPRPRAEGRTLQIEQHEGRRACSACPPRGRFTPESRGAHTHAAGVCPPSEAAGLRELVERLCPAVCLFGHHHRAVAEIGGVRRVGVHTVGRPGHLVAFTLELGVALEFVDQWPRPAGRTG